MEKSIRFYLISAMGNYLSKEFVVKRRELPPPRFSSYEKEKRETSLNIVPRFEQHRETSFPPRSGTFNFKWQSHWKEEGSEGEGKI